MGWARGIVLVVAATTVASAQPKSEPTPVIGAQAVLKASASSGFVDDVATSDATRFVYVVADGTTKAALHIADIAKPETEQIVDVSTVTLQPTALHLVGQRVLVIGASDGKHVAAAIELAGKKVSSTAYKLGPADHITVITRDGKQRIAVHDHTGTKHTINVFAIENGRRVQAGKGLELDANGHNAKLDFRVNHWSDGWTRAYGIKAGEWDRKEDQKAPDQEAMLDVVTGKLEKKKIEDHFDQKRRFQVLAENALGLDFVRVDRGVDLQLWKAGKGKKLELDQPFTNYDPKTVQAIVLADGSGWVALKVDPVNADAVARKKADPEYLDIFRFTADGKAVRKARVFAKGVRHRFGIAGERFWLMERNAGFERGSKTVTLYQLQ